MVKVVMFDIDGTLRDEQLGVKESTVQAIRECKSKGIRVGICTGRIFPMIQDDVLEIGFDIMISGDGSQIVIDNQLIQDLNFDSEIVKELIESLDNERDGIAIETKKQVYMNKIACDFLKQSNQQKGSVERKIAYKDNLHKLSLSNEQVSKVCVWTLKELPIRKDVQYVQKIKTQHLYYEMVDLYSGKGNAIKTVRKYLDIKKEDILCFGDGYNDLDMFKECGFSIAMANSVDELRQVADAVCLSHKEDGIYKALINRKIIGSVK